MLLDLPAPSLQAVQISWLHSEPGKEADAVDTELEIGNASLTDMRAIISGRDGTQGSSFKPKEGKFRLDTRKQFFSARMRKHEGRLSRETVGSPSRDVESWAGVLGKLVLAKGGAAHCRSLD